jgi:riboflavin synthase
MFTGLIEACGRVHAFRREGSGARLEIAWELAHELTVGQSIAVAGVCLTVTGRTGSTFEVTAVDETLRRTTLGSRRAGDRVNLERSVRVGDRLDGHLVQGHVDGVATVTEVRPVTVGRELGFSVTPDLHRFVAEKGSVALDGVSLTVADVTPRGFRVALIPHTLAVTTLSELRVGQHTNIEVDVVARYAARLMQGEISGKAHAF